MARAARWSAAGLIALLVAALVACSTGEKVDLGDDASGRLVAAIAGEPDQLDPNKTSAYFSFEVLENVYDTLVEPDANLEMRPALAESWDVSPDQLTWTFHLRPGVTFHDGSPLHRRRRGLHLPPHHRRGAVERRQAQRRHRRAGDEPGHRRHAPQGAHPESADQPRRLQRHGDRATQERRKRPDRHPPDRHRSVRVRRPEEW